MEYYPGTGRNHLFVPGPSNIPEKVQQAMARNNEDHRSPAFPKFSKSLLEDVKQIFKSKISTSFIFPSTGTGAWEISLTNTLSPGDKILTFRSGQFGVLWIRMMQRLKLDVDVVDSEWGTGVDLGILKKKLDEDSDFAIKALCIIHNETSTGVTNDLAAIRGILDAYKHPALLLVDGISSIGALDFRMDEWKVDVAITGSQKALGLPTGLGIVCASPKAIEASKTSKSIRAYFDWADYLEFYKVGSYWPYTPSGQLLYGLRAALDLILEEGVDNVIKRHHRLGHATRYIDLIFFFRELSLPNRSHTSFVFLSFQKSSKETRSMNDDSQQV
ncbi:hypothetical protein O6H91_Y264900 [Diphasiastrum complanatum]|nr:hypothetical protein O6H91_Y264900 [Diphasiastrum complanatum]